MVVIKREAGVLHFRIEQHLFEIHQPDLVIARFVGVVTPEEFAEYVAVLMDELGQGPGIFSIVDLRKCGSVSPETRKVVPRLVQHVPLRGGVIWGGRPVIMAVVSMMLKMINFLRRDDNPTYVAESEAAAHAWVDQRRAALRAQMGAGHE
jgi:hypothetical protein